MSESLRQRLIADTRERGYAELRRGFQSRDPQDVYAILFPIAVEYGSDGGDSIAAQLLVETEPPCPVTCEDALTTVATAKWWQVSDERVPFYLLAQFGRRELFGSIARLVSDGRLDAKQAPIVDSVGYWARLPTLTLAERISEYGFPSGSAAG